MKKKGSRKYGAELEKIKRLRTLDSILKRSDVESALLSNAAKDSEPVRENLIDNILDNLSKEKDGERNLEIIEELSMSKKGTRISKSKRVRVKKKGKKITVKRKLHLVKKRKKRSS